MIDTSRLSLMQRVSLMTAAEQAEFFKDFTEEDFASLEHDWSVWARPDQLIQDDPYIPVQLFLTGRGWGKDLSISTPIWHSNGRTTIGELSVGDRVFAHDGTLCTVTKIQDFTARPTYRVTFNDGSSIEAGETHEWNVFRGKTHSYYAAERDLSKQHSDWWSWSYQRKQRRLVVPNEVLTRAKELRVDGVPWGAMHSILTREFAHLALRPKQTDGYNIRKVLGGDVVNGVDTPRANRAPRTSLLVETKDLRPGDRIPTALPLEREERTLAVDPYIFGLWLGDGFTKDGAICGAPDDLEVYLPYLTAAGYDDLKFRDMNSGCGTVSSKKLKADLKSLGLLNGPKRVPGEYLLGSRRQRLELLRGLMDTDGNTEIGGIKAGAGFVLEELADAVYHLVVSLGMIAYRRNRALVETKTKPQRLFYGVNFRATPELNPFRLPRKANMVGAVPRAQGSRKTMRTVESVEYIGETKTRCIAIDHPSQLFLAGDALVPTHNTRASAEWVRQQVKNHPGCAIAVAGRTAKDVRDVFILGESGIMNVCPDEEKPVYRPSEARLVWPQYENAQVFLYSAESPEAPRGNQFHYYLLDEYASHTPFRGPDGATCAENIMVAARLGDKPYGVITTTPRRVEHLKKLIERAKTVGDVRIVRGRTDENTALSTTYINQINAMLGDNERLRQQELDGVLLDADTEGALWSQQDFDDARDFSESIPAGAALRVVSVDPSVAESPRDECGIIVLGATNHRDVNHRHAYVLEDATIKASPEVWAQKVVDTAHKWSTRYVIVEMNQGQHLVKMAIKAIDPNLMVIGVNSAKGKKLRAEPVAVATKRRRVHMWGMHEKLEDQACTWVPEHTKGYSPDRVDAFVHGVTALLIDPPKGLFNGPIRTSTRLKGRSLPTGGRGTGKTYRGGTTK